MKPVWAVVLSTGYRGIVWWHYIGTGKPICLQWIRLLKCCEQEQLEKFHITTLVPTTIPPLEIYLYFVFIYIYILKYIY